MPVPAFTRHGPLRPASPVVLSVPHAGRDYPYALRAALKVPPAALTTLEDRHADTLARAAATDQTLIVASRARAWIDLNRAEDERDPRLDEGAPRRAPVELSIKLRSGLGLVPRRASGWGDLWKRRLSNEEVMHRIRTDHRPYHHALAAELEAVRAVFGIAILLDVHSMPSLLPVGSSARVVLGDRYGKSSAARFVSRAEAACQAHGVRTATNTPYSGGHLLDRHGAPARGIHAIQLEFDRALYLDAKLDAPGSGFGATVALLREIVAAVADEALPVPLAAE